MQSHPCRPCSWSGLCGRVVPRYPLMPKVNSNARAWHSHQQYLPFLWGLTWP